MIHGDLLIVGAGPGGCRAAEYAAGLGLQVVVIEKDEVGGTCLNRGCIPTKTYVHSATFDEAVGRQQQVVQQLRSGLEQQLSAPGITLLRGRATFQDAHTVSVEGCGLVTASHVIIATGSSATVLAVEGTDDPRVVTSTGLLRLNTLPRRLCVVGAGVVGMEMACAFRRFGSEVTVVEGRKECLPLLDSDVARRLRRLMERRGIEFRMKTAVQSLTEVDADVVLMATGRRPNVADDFRNVGFDYDEGSGISVDGNFETTVKGVYAIGDVNGRQLLAHAAAMQAVRAVNHIVGCADGIRFDVMPAAVFTTPEAACVGASEDALRAQGAEYRCRKAFWRANGKALAMGEDEGLLKLLSDADDRIVGCHAFGCHAADIVQEVSVLMCRDTTVGQLRDMVHIHPTLSEVLLSAAQC